MSNHQYHSLCSMLTRVAELSDSANLLGSALHAIEKLESPSDQKDDLAILGNLADYLRDHYPVMSTAELQFRMRIVRSMLLMSV